jgi:hypothetical protein
VYHRHSHRQSALLHIGRRYDLPRGGWETWGRERGRSR